MFEKSKLIDYIKSIINFWNCVRFTFILICSGWFCYNAIQIIEKYIQYNTIVMVKYEQPNQTDLPAITICTSCFISEDNLKHYYPEYVEELSKLSNSDEKGRSKLKGDFITKALEDHSAHFIFDNMSVQFDELFKSCYFVERFDRNITIDCQQIAPIVQSIYERRKCFTIFSQLNVTDRQNTNKQIDYEMDSYIKMEIWQQRHIEVTPLEDASIIFAVHQPNIIPTILDVEYYRIFPDKTYDFRFIKQISFLMPPPFKTMCRDYDRTNPKGEKSRGDCINWCIKKETFDLSKCNIYYGILTPDMLYSKEKICSESGDYRNYTNARRKCMDFCQMTCTEETIQIPYADEITSSPHTPNRSIIRVSSDSTLYTYVYHEEALGESEFIGNLGGHAHIWLGLSALKLFNFIVHLFNRFKQILIN